MVKDKISRLLVVVRAKLRSLLMLLPNMSRKQLLIVCGALSASIVLIHTVQFFWPRNQTFTYAQPQTCFFNPVLFPGLVSPQPGTTFRLSLTPNVSLGNFPIFSHTTCITASQAPKAGSAETVSLSLFGNSILKKNIRITADALPKLLGLAIPDRPVSVKDQLRFNLNQADHVFGYQLSANSKQVGCNKNNKQVACDVSKLGLAQGATYEFTLERTFNAKSVETIFRQSAKTVEPVQITASTIAGGEKVYHAPTEIVLTLNKPASSVKNVRLQRLQANNARQDLKITQTLSGDKVTIKFTEALPRDAQFELIIEQIEAQDNGYLPAPYMLPFSTSGGPKVLGINIGSYKVAPSSSFTLTLDSAPAAGQDLAKFVRVEVGGSAAASAITLRGKSITIHPNTSLGACTTFSVKLLDGIKNEHGISGGSAWQFNSRTLCQVVTSIGQSVQGRSILAYRFGGGGTKIIFSGTLHGNEKSATHTLNSWIDYLEANPGLIPGHMAIIVIPNVNPDGYAANTRTNAHNVDLNRNFAANNWKSGVTMPGGSYLEQGGGSAPLSEPESRALANYVSAQGARLVLSYHSIGPLVAANESGDSLAIARTYGSKAGFPAYGNDASGQFHYDTTGAFEDWLHDKLGIPCLLVELETRGFNEFSGQRSAMRAMLQL
ncbi:MAG: DUF2817 domain-containing protein [Candidatus Saccharimonadales bacterium]